MRTLCAFFRWFYPGLVLVGLPFLSLGADLPENVVLQYHFVGADHLAADANVGVAKKVFALKSTAGFEELVLAQLATNLSSTLHLSTDAATIASLRPLLEDALEVESLGNMGGWPGQPINFVFAFHLGQARAQVWQETLKKASSLWTAPSGEWLLVGRGDALAAVRANYLAQIQKIGRPAPALDFNSFEADVDWPRMTNWYSMDFCPLKLARTKVAISAQGGRFDMVGKITYPEAIAWQPKPMILPTNLVREPLLSFSTGQNVEPFLKSDQTLSRLGNDPFRDQFYFWSMKELAFESYCAWPCADPTNTMKKLAPQIISEFNPKIKELDNSELVLRGKGMRVGWAKLPFIAPSVHPAAPANGPFLLAELFSLTPGTGRAPNALWSHLEGRTNLVFYDWELTGPRVRHLLTITQILPILRILDIGPPVAPPGPRAPVDPRQAVQELWLANLTPFLANTVTEVTQTGPKELTVIRNSPFVFNSLELVLLSHWLTDTPAGPVDGDLLPQAKMSGTGIPSKAH